MKQIFVTYREGTILKKAVINEDRYKELSTKTTINELVVYPNALIMEQNYNLKCSDGSCKPNNKNILHG